MIGRLVLLLCVCLAGCPYRGNTIPRGPHAIEPLNSEYDDINMAAPPHLDRYVWSTNRGTKGGKFDLWTASGTFYDGALSVRKENKPRPFAPAASSGNEYGPTWHVHGRSVESRWSAEATLVFASDRAGGRGGLDLYRVDPDTARIEPMNELNSASNDAYWTLTRNSEFFVSDRAGKGLDLFEVIRGEDGKVEIRRLDALCTDADETALSATNAYNGGVTLLFASNRAGGEGGWDLYYAVREDGKWSKPKNFGKRFNTEHNEFRPVASQGSILFSSDRPGGKGGYDLYRAREPSLR